MAAHVLLLCHINWWTHVDHNSFAFHSPTWEKNLKNIAKKNKQRKRRHFKSGYFTACLSHSCTLPPPALFSVGMQPIINLLCSLKCPPPPNPLPAERKRGEGRVCVCAEGWWLLLINGANGAPPPSPTLLSLSTTCLLSVVVLMACTYYHGAAVWVLPACIIGSDRQGGRTQRSRTKGTPRPSSSSSPFPHNRCRLVLFLPFRDAKL